MYVRERKEFYSEVGARQDYSLGKAFAAAEAQGLRFQSSAPLQMLTGMVPPPPPSNFRVRHTDSG